MARLGGWFRIGIGGRLSTKCCTDDALWAYIVRLARRAGIDLDPKVHYLRQETMALFNRRYPWEGTLHLEARGDAQVAHSEYIESMLRQYI